MTVAFVLRLLGGKCLLCLCLRIQLTQVWSPEGRSLSDFQPHPYALSFYIVRWSRGLTETTHVKNGVRVRPKRGQQRVSVSFPIRLSVNFHELRSLPEPGDSLCYTVWPASPSGPAVFLFFCFLFSYIPDLPALRTMCGPRPAFAMGAGNLNSCSRAYTVGTHSYPLSHLPLYALNWEL